MKSDFAFVLVCRLGPCSQAVMERLASSKTADLDRSLTWPDSLIVAVLQREHMLAKAKLHELSFERVTKEIHVYHLRRLIRLVSQDSMSAWHLWCVCIRSGLSAFCGHVHVLQLSVSCGSSVQPSLTHAVHLEAMQGGCDPKMLKMQMHVVEAIAMRQYLQIPPLTAVICET